MAQQQEGPRKWKHASFEPQSEQLEFHVWRGVPTVMDHSHVHTDIEFNYIVRGGITYFAAGRLHNVAAGEWAVFWAGMPHEVTAVEAETEMVWLIVPLAWFIQWRLPVAFEKTLLCGAFLHVAGSEYGSHDALQFQRWADEMQGASPEEKAEIRSIILLEVEARLWRHSRSMEKQTAASSGVATGHDTAVNEIGASQIEKLARYMSEHYREDLNVSQIAAAVGLHPKYAMQLFKDQSGVSLWEYLTRLRISHAQRLLLTSDAKIERIVYEAGFGSTARFYTTFKRYCNSTPREWRLAHGRKIGGSE